MSRGDMLGTTAQNVLYILRPAAEGLKFPYGDFPYVAVPLRVGEACEVRAQLGPALAHSQGRGPWPVLGWVRLFGPSPAIRTDGLNTWPPL